MIEVRSQPRQIVSETLSWKYPSQKKSWQSGSRWRLWVQAPVPQKKRKKEKVIAIACYFHAFSPVSSILNRIQQFIYEMLFFPYGFTVFKYLYLINYVNNPFFFHHTNMYMQQLAQCLMMCWALF
jgi:hypothetical protein